MDTQHGSIKDQFSSLYVCKRINIESKMGNDHDILPCIFSVLKWLDPNVAQQCEESIRKNKAPQNDKDSLENDSKILDDCNDHHEQGDDDDHCDVPHAPPELASPASTTTDILIPASNSNTSSPSDDTFECNERLVKLREMGISWFNSTW